MTKNEEKKYFVSLVILGEKDVLNLIIKNIYEDYSLTFYKTLVKTIVENENIDLDLLSEDDCELIDKKYMGYIELESIIFTENPIKILNKLREDQNLINQYLNRYKKTKIEFRLAIKSMFFKDENYKAIVF